ncbi:MAG: hypothetical protein JWN30_194 [Bacilli bacterium]|nr:hypothetical protein [Bacilli bacterium]
MILPEFILQIALLIILVRSVYVAIQLLNSSHKAWLDILFHISVAIFALFYYSEHFGHFF